MWMMGTEGYAGVPPGAPDGYAERHSVAPICTLGIVGGSSADTPEPLGMKGAGSSQHRPASLRVQLPGMDSNHDKEYQNPFVPLPNANPDIGLRLTDGEGRSEQCVGEITEADLAALVVSWPTLPEPIKAAIRALIGAVSDPA